MRLFLLALLALLALISSGIARAEETDIFPPTQVEQLRSRVLGLELEVGTEADSGLKRRITLIEPRVQEIVGELGMGTDNGLKHRLKVAELKLEELGQTVVFVSFVNKYVFTPIIVVVIAHALLGFMKSGRIP